MPSLSSLGEPTTNPNNDSLLDTGEHSDLVLRCSDGTEFNVHKAIVCSQSQLFRFACKPEKFKVSDAMAPFLLLGNNISDRLANEKQEGNENRIDLTVGNSTTINSLLKYLYTMEYVNHAAPEDVLTTDVDVYVVADFYAVPVLKKLIAAQFENHLAKLWNTDLFSQAVQTIYTDTPITGRNLRDMALDTIMEHTTDLIETGEGADPTPLTEVMDYVPELGKDLTLRLISNGESSNPESETREVRVERLVLCGCGYTWGISVNSYRPLHFPACDGCGMELVMCEEIE